MFRFSSLQGCLPGFVGKNILARLDHTHPLEPVSLASSEKHVAVIGRRKHTVALFSDVPGVTSDERALMQYLRQPINSDTVETVEGVHVISYTSRTIENVELINNTALLCISDRTIVSMTMHNGQWYHDGTVPFPDPAEECVIQALPDGGAFLAYVSATAVFTSTLSIDGFPFIGPPTPVLVHLPWTATLDPTPEGILISSARSQFVYLLTGAREVKLLPLPAPLLKVVPSTSRLLLLLTDGAIVSCRAPVESDPPVGSLTDHLLSDRFDLLLTPVQEISVKLPDDLRPPLLLSMEDCLLQADDANGLWIVTDISTDLSLGAIAGSTSQAPNVPARVWTSRQLIGVVCSTGVAVLQFSPDGIESALHGIATQGMKPHQVAAVVREVCGTTVDVPDDEAFQQVAVAAYVVYVLCKHGILFGSRLSVLSALSQFVQSVTSYCLGDRAAQGGEPRALFLMARAIIACVGRLDAQPIHIAPIQAVLQQLPGHIAPSQTPPTRPTPPVPAAEGYAAGLVEAATAPDGPAMRAVLDELFSGEQSAFAVLDAVEASVDLHQAIVTHTGVTGPSLWEGLIGPLPAIDIVATVFSHAAPTELGGLLEAYEAAHLHPAATDVSCYTGTLEDEAALRPRPVATYYSVTTARSTEEVLDAIPDDWPARAPMLATQFERLGGVELLEGLGCVQQLDALKSSTLSTGAIK